MINEYLINAYKINLISIYIVGKHKFHKCFFPNKQVIDLFWLGRKYFNQTGNFDQISDNFDFASSILQQLAI